MTSKLKKPEVLWKIIIALFGLIYAGLHFAFFGEEVNAKNVFHSLSQGLIVTLLVELVAMWVELSCKIEHKVSRQKVWMTRYLKDEKGLGARLLRIIDNELQHAVGPEDNGFAVHGATLAVDTYVDFWRLMIQEQQTRKTQGQSSLKCRMIHSCDCHVWIDHPQTQRLLQLQKEFIDSNGEIIRIVCGHGSTPTELASKAIKNMASVGIQVWYHDVDQPLVHHPKFSFGWDFLRIEGMDQVAIWESFGHGANRPIGKAIYARKRTHEGEDLEDLWEEIKRQATKPKSE